MSRDSPNKRKEQTFSVVFELRFETVRLALERYNRRPAKIYTDGVQENFDFGTLNWFVGYDICYPLGPVNVSAN